MNLRFWARRSSLPPTSLATGLTQSVDARMLDVRSEATINAFVNAVASATGSADVTLYDAHSRAMRVAPDQVEYFIREHGFSRVRADPAAALAGMDPLWDAAHDAIRRAVARVSETGQIETHPDAAWHTAVLAFDQLTQAFGQLHSDVQATYPSVPDPNQAERDAAAAKVSEAGHA